MFARFISFALLILVACSLSSCIDYEEDMTVHENLSGEATVKLTLPDMLIEKYTPLLEELKEVNLRKRFKSLDGVRLEGYAIKEGRRPEIQLLVKFDSLEKLSKAAEANPPASILVGKFDVTKELGKIIVKRKLGEGEAPLKIQDTNHVIYKCHFDGSIAGTDSGFFNFHGKDIRYRYQLQELMTQKPTQVNTLRPAIPWLWIGLSAVIIIGAIWVGWNMFGKKMVRVPGEARMRRTKQPIIPKPVVNQQIKVPVMEPQIPKPQVPGPRIPLQTPNKLQRPRPPK
ncbi:MAG: hypothetical protein RL693_1808 [Verrucomicrobiota bacterium]|jgi:hypothetical protein